MQNIFFLKKLNYPAQIGKNDTKHNVVLSPPC